MQSKLKLNLDDLVVDSFDTSRRPEKRGTVFGEQCTCYTNCTCPGCPTCYASCNGTCGDTCAATCAYTCDDVSCAGSCNASCGGSCDYSCGDTQCAAGWTCGNCTALQTNCNEICF